MVQKGVARAEFQTWRQKHFRDICTTILLSSYIKSTENNLGLNSYNYGIPILAWPIDTLNFTFSIPPLTLQCVDQCTIEVSYYSLLWEINHKTTIISANMSTIPHFKCIVYVHEMYVLSYCATIIIIFLSIELIIGIWKRNGL